MVSAKEFFKVDLKGQESRCSKSVSDSVGVCIHSCHVFWVPSKCPRLCWALTYVVSNPPGLWGRYDTHFTDKVWQRKVQEGLLLGKILCPVHCCTPSSGTASGFLAASPRNVRMKRLNWRFMCLCRLPGAAVFPLYLETLSSSSALPSPSEFRGSSAPPPHTPTPGGFAGPHLSVRLWGPSTGSLSALWGRRLFTQEISIHILKSGWSRRLDGNNCHCVSTGQELNSV